MKLGRLSIILMSFLFSSSGCDEFQQAQQKPKPVKSQTVIENRVPVRRFILTKYNADVAFDTQTGQLCKTWEWEPTAKLTPQQEASGVHPARAMGEILADMYFVIHPVSFRSRHNK